MVTKSMANPYLTAKLVEALFVSSPRASPTRESWQHLAPAFMRFYTDVILIKSLWESPCHKEGLLREASDGRQFVSFVNMLMKDMMLLLDESLESLKRIHQTQEVVDGSSCSAQQTRQRQLQQDERQCRSYLTLARETVDMLHYLTTDIEEPFLHPVS
ncbi:ubiquitin conjugation factor E4 B-like isoform X2 [Ornithodoros turicata]|uniref:ubiquitin conjugation factor E4 B-like isoform X2 n=1 Tax=Ornithodoros turicata TaxID=34597 RepID=UPI0031388B36